MTSKERAELRAQANTIETTLIVGKGGVSEQVLQEASNLLDAHELIKGKVLETAMLTAREASAAICSGSRHCANERNISVPIISQSVSPGCRAAISRSVSTV